MGLLADSSRDDAFVQHLQSGGYFVKGDDFRMPTGFHDCFAAAIDACSSKEESINFGMRIKQLPCECIAFEFIVMNFCNIGYLNPRIRCLQRMAQPADSFTVAKYV